MRAKIEFSHVEGTSLRNIITFAKQSIELEMLAQKHKKIARISSPASIDGILREGLHHASLILNQGGTWEDCVPILRQTKIAIILSD